MKIRIAMKFGNRHFIILRLFLGFVGLFIRGRPTQSHQIQWLLEMKGFVWESQLGSAFVHILTNGRTNERRSNEQTNKRRTNVRTKERRTIERTSEQRSNERRTDERVLARRGGARSVKREEWHTLRSSLSPVSRVSGGCKGGSWAAL